MAQLELPQDRNTVAKLAVNIRKNHRALSKQHGGKLPKEYLEDLKPAPKVARVLDQADALEAQANALRRSVDEPFAAIQRGLRNVCNMQVRLGGPELAKKWGFTFVEPRPEKPPKRRRKK